MDFLARIGGTMLQSRLIEVSDEATHRKLPRGLEPFQDVIVPTTTKRIRPKHRTDYKEDESIQNDEDVSKAEPGALSGYYMSNSIHHSLNEFRDNLELKNHDELINQLINEYGSPTLVRELTYEDFHLTPFNLREYQAAQDASLQASRRTYDMYSSDDDDDKILQTTPWIIDRNTTTEKMMNKYLSAIYDKVELRVCQKREKMKMVKKYRKVKQAERAKVIQGIAAKMKRYVPMIAKRNIEMKKWELMRQIRSKQIKAYCEFIPDFKGTRLEVLIQSVLEEIPFGRERAYHSLMRDSRINPASPELKDEDNQLIKAKRAELMEISCVLKRDQDREGFVRQLECQVIQFVENMLGKDAEQPARFQKILDPLQHEKHDLEHSFYSLFDLKKLLEETVEDEELELQGEAKHRHMRIENKRLRSMEKSILALNELEAKLRDYFRGDLWTTHDHMLLKKIHVDQREYYGDYYMGFSESEFTSSESGESEEVRPHEDETKEEKLEKIAKQKSEFEDEYERKGEFADKYHQLLPKFHRERRSFGVLKELYKEIVPSKEFFLHEKECAAIAKREQKERLVRLKNFSKKYRKIWGVRERRLETMQIKLKNLRIESDLRQAAMSGEYQTLHKLPLCELVRLKVSKSSELPKKDTRQTGPLCEYIEQRHKVEDALKHCRVEWPEWSDTGSEFEISESVSLVEEEEPMVSHAPKLKQRGIFVNEWLKKEWQKKYAPKPKATYLEQALKIHDSTDWGYGFKDVNTDIHPIYPCDGKRLGKGIHTRDYELFSLNWFGPGKKFDVEREKLEEEERKAMEEREKREKEQKRLDRAKKWQDIQQKRLEAWQRKYSKMMESIHRKMEAFDRVLARRQYYEEMKMYGESSIPRPDTEFVWRMKERRDTASNRVKERHDENERKKTLQLMINAIKDKKKIQWSMHSG